MRRNRRTGQPIVPTYKITGDSSLASTHLPAARDYLMRANRVFGQHRYFSTSTLLPDGTAIKAVKAGRQFLLFVDAPIEQSFSINPEGLLTLMVVPRYDHTKGLSISPISNALTSTGQNRGILGHYSIGILSKNPDIIPNDKFKEFFTAPQNVQDVGYAGTNNFRQKVIGAIGNYNSAVGNAANTEYDWAFKQQIELTRDYTIQSSSGIPQYTSQTGDPDIPPPQTNELSEALEELDDVSTGNIDWRSLAGEIYSIKGPSGRGVPATVSGMTITAFGSVVPSEASGNTSEYDLYTSSGRFRGAARVDAFGREIFKDGKVLVRVPEDSIVIGMCTRKFVDTQTNLLEDFIIAATVKPSLIFESTTFQPGLTMITFISQKISENLNFLGWEEMDSISDYNPNYAFFFSSSGNKGISTFNNHTSEPGLDYNTTTSEEPVHFESYSTLRTTFVDPLNITIDREDHDPVVFPTTRAQEAIPFAGERRYSKSFNNIGQVWISFISPHHASKQTNTTPEAEVITRVSSDFKYQTEQEVYVEKRIKFKANALVDELRDLGVSRSETTQDEPVLDPNLPDIQDNVESASAEMAISYYQSFVGEFSSNTDLSDISNSNIGLTCDPTSITSAPSQGTGALQLIGEVISTYEETTINDGTTSAGDLRDGEMQMTACDLRFGLAVYNIVINDYTPHIVTELNTNSNLTRPVITNSDFYGWMLCPGRFTKELPDITSDIVQEGSSPSSANMHVGNQSYFNTVRRSTLYITGVEEDMALYSGHLPYDGRGLDPTLLGSFIYDYTPHGYDGFTASFPADGTDTTPVLNPSVRPARSLVREAAATAQYYLPLFPTGSSRLDISGLYAAGQQLTYTIVGIDKDHYAAFTPWLEHLPGYDFDPSNDAPGPNNEPGGPKTNDSDIWQAAGAPQLPIPTAADKTLLQLDGDFLTEDYYKNLSVYRGIKESKVAVGMKSYEDADPIQTIT